MSGFMDYLNSVDITSGDDTVSDNNIMEEVYVEPIKKKVQHKRKKVKSRKKNEISSGVLDTSVIRQRIEDKLLDVGLNENAISSVVSYVFSGDISKSNTTKKVSQVDKVDKVNHIENTNTSTMSIAESLLDDSRFYDTHSSNTPIVEGDSVTTGNSNGHEYSEVFDKASSLLA